MSRDELWDDGSGSLAAHMDGRFFFCRSGKKTHHTFLNIYLALPFWLQILLSIGLAGIKESCRWGGTGGGREWGGGGGRDGGVGGEEGKNHIVSAL